MSKITTAKALTVVTHGINILSALATVLATVKAVGDAAEGR